MAVMMGKLYAALRDANVPEDRATAAAEEAAAFENGVASLRNEFTVLRGRVDLLTWMIGFNLAMSVALVGKVFLAR